MKERWNRFCRWVTWENLLDYFAGVKRAAQRTALTGLLLMLFLLIGCRGGLRDMEAAVERGRATAMAERDAAELSARIEAEAAAVTPELKARAELLAKLLFSQCPTNSAAQKYDFCWIPINRTEDPRWPDNIEDVIRQEGQWMGRAEDNPVLEEDYQIALRVLIVWEEGGHRPVHPRFVFLEWHTDYLIFRSEFLDSPTCEYYYSRE